MPSLIARPKRPMLRGQSSFVSQKNGGLQVGSTSLPLLSGAFHYWRTPREQWRSCLQALRDLGLLLVETYIPWSVHETEKGEFDFGEHDAQKDLNAFLELARELRLWVFVRPGPHINAELTGFGLPQRILEDPNCLARSPEQNPLYVPFPPVFFPAPSYASSAFFAEVGPWFDAVGAQLKPHLYPQGPVVLVQIDNEAAFYFRNAVYEQDYHPDALAAWRAYLKKKYGSLHKANAQHNAHYRTWEEAKAPVALDAQKTQDLPLHLDWAFFQEALIVDALGRMKERLSQAGVQNLPTVHNLPLGELGLPAGFAQLERAVDIVGLDYYHSRSEHATIKRRTLLLSGSVNLPFAPEMGVGAPPWFKPLSHEDSLFCAMCACAYGLRGFNLYMAVDRDRWYGAPIEPHGLARVEAGVWKTWIHALRNLQFHRLKRRTEVGLMVPREYVQLNRVAHRLGPLSASTLEAFGLPPFMASFLPFASEDFFRTDWWQDLEQVAAALTEANIAYVYVDGDVPVERLQRFRFLVSPSFAFADPQRWRRLCTAAGTGTQLFFGPHMPSLDCGMSSHLFEVPRQSENLSWSTPQGLSRLIRAVQAALPTPASFQVSPAPLETTVHEDNARPCVLFLINPSEVPLNAVIELACPTQAKDVLNHEIFDGQVQLRIPIPAQRVRMFELEMEALRVSDSILSGDAS